MLSRNVRARAQVKGLEFRALGLACTVYGLELRVWGLGV